MNLKLQEKCLATKLKTKSDLRIFRSYLEVSISLFKKEGRLMERERLFPNSNFRRGASQKMSDQVCLEFYAVFSMSLCAL